MDSWNSTIIPESDLILFIAAINNDEETIRTELQKSIELYSHITRNILREVVFIYHNNQFNPNHTNDLKQNEWQKKLNSFDKDHDGIDFALSDSSRYFYPNELPLYRIRLQLMRLDPSHFHHILINPTPISQSVDLLHSSSDIRRLARWLSPSLVVLLVAGDMLESYVLCKS